MYGNGFTLLMSYAMVPGTFDSDECTICGWEQYCTNEQKWFAKEILSVFTARFAIVCAAAHHYGYKSLHWYAAT